MKMLDDEPRAGWLPDAFSTSWRITSVPDWPATLDVTLVVSTTAASVVSAIETAAAKHGVVLAKQQPTEGNERA